MSTAGLVTMLVVWGIVIFVVSYFFIRVVRTPQPPEDETVE
jgi:hypothetical protein